MAGVVGIERALFITVSMASDWPPGPPTGETMFPFQNWLSELPTPNPLDELDGGVGKEMLRSSPGLES